MAAAAEAEVFPQVDGHTEYEKMFESTRNWVVGTQWQSKAGKWRGAAADWCVTEKVCLFHQSHCIQRSLSHLSIHLGPWSKLRIGGGRFWDRFSSQKNRFID